MKKAFTIVVSFTREAFLKFPKIKVSTNILTATLLK